jgi:TRAP-type C4-dicarboxylate transport system substrate-binding protein
MHWMKGRACRATAALAVIAAAVAGGCGDGGASGDKAGGSGEPVVLRMANAYANLDYIPAIEDFVTRVRERSGGNVRIEVVHDVGEGSADAEEQVVRAVAAGQVDLGWSGTRVFDTMGVTSFQALHAPMLIDSYALQHAVIASDIPGPMLEGLNKIGVRGLGLLADGLRKPIAVKRPLLGPADWRGITFQSFRSQTQAEAIRALGAQPTDVWSGLDEGLETGKIDGFEKNFLVYQLNAMAGRAPYVTANVNLWPQMDALFGNPGRLAALTEQQRGWLQQSATEAAGRSAALADRDTQILATICESGARLANASNRDLAALREAFAPVHAKLQDNPQTKQFIEQILALKRSTAAEAPLVIPAGCSGPAPAQPGAQQGTAAGSQLDGVYRWTLTKKDVLEHGTESDKTADALARFPILCTMTLNNGAWQMGDDRHYSGTYAVTSDRVVFDWPNVGSVLTFTFSVDDKGNLALRPIGPMDAGDKFVWSTKVWTKIR